MNRYKVTLASSGGSAMGDDVYAENQVAALKIAKKLYENEEWGWTVYVDLAEKNASPHVKKYRSIPFEAFLLMPDMSNWREACLFMGDMTDYSDPEYNTPPDFLDVRGEDDDYYAVKNNYICKTANGYFEVWPYEEFVKTFQEA